MSDDTRIQIHNEEDRSSQNQSALWIRWGGPPDSLVVLADYAASKSGATAYKLLSKFHGTLVCDSAKASARVFSLIEPARTIGHNPQHYLSVLLTEPPRIQAVEDIEKLLPWNLTPNETASLHAGYPAP